MSKRRFSQKCRLTAALLLLNGAALHADEGLGALPLLDAQDQATAVGVSAGGYMANQLAVAWPERFDGLGVVAAGPWGCSQGALSLALRQCMSVSRGLPSLDTLEQRRQRYQGRSLVGEEAALGTLRVFVYQGEDDEVVDPALGALLATQWERLLSEPEATLHFEQDAQTGHGWPVRLPENANLGPYAMGDCRQGGGSYLLACDNDVAAQMLDWLYPERPSKPSDGELVAFDQTPFEASGLADIGYLFVPDTCREQQCPVTVALHGCQMSVDAIDDAFVRHSGLNRWAADHAQIVLYPQAESSLANPQGCWDWWGFAESTWQLNPLHDTRDGVQVQALMAMLDRLQSAP